MSKVKTVAIIGAGPVGLAAAAHVLERGMTPIVLEAGPEPAHAVRQWQHVQLFSPWEYNVDKAAERLLAPTGWNSPDPQVYPDRRRTARALSRSARDQDAAVRRDPHLQPGHRRRAASASTRRRPGAARTAPFEIRYQNGKGPETLRADAVIDASGTWRSPNPAGANGLPAIGEREVAVADRVRDARCPRQGSRAASPARPSRCSAPVIPRSVR